MARPAIGVIECPFHPQPLAAAVKRDKNGRLYFWCPGCGPVQPHGDAFQEWMLERAVILSPDKREVKDNADDRRAESRV